MGDGEGLTLVGLESLVKYHPEYYLVLTESVIRTSGQCLMGSLTGAVAS